MNTNAPNPFATDTNVVLSGAGRPRLPPRKVKEEPEFNWIENEKRSTMPRKKKQEPKFELYESATDEMDGSGWMGEIKKGYNKTKSAVKSKTGQKIKKH